MPSIDSVIRQQKILIIGLKELQSLVAVCAGALRDTGATEDDAVVDVLMISANRLWDLSEGEAKKLEALEATFEGGE